MRDLVFCTSFVLFVDHVLVRDLAFLWGKYDIIDFHVVRIEVYHGKIRA